MNSKPNKPPSLSHDDNAVIEHMKMYQGIITRMASNSASCKKWCIPLITAILAFVVKEKLIELVWLTLIPIIIFYFLDVYYLKLENQFRNGFNLCAKKIQNDDFFKDDLFNMLPSGSESEFWLKAVTSPSTWSVYFGLFGLLVVSYKML